MADVGYVYTLAGTADELRAEVERRLAGPHWHWVAELARLTLGDGLPAVLGDRGAVCAGRGELRWWRQGDRYEGLLLVDESQVDLTPTGEAWQTFPTTLKLADLNDLRYRPNFPRYPTGDTTGRVSARLYIGPSGAQLLSLRRLLLPAQEE